MALKEKWYFGEIVKTKTEEKKYNLDTNKMVRKVAAKNGVHSINVIKRVKMQ